MSATFVVEKRISLDFLGKNWNEAYVTFTPFTWDDNKKLLSYRKKLQSSNSQEDLENASDEIRDLIKGQLIEGKGWNGEKLIAITKENLGALPMEAMQKFIDELQGGITSKKNPLSGA